MRRTFANPMEFRRRVPVIVAELASARQWFPKGTRLYLATPQHLDAETCTCIGRTRLGQLREIDVGWNDMRFVEVKAVEARIAQACYRAKREELQDLVKAIEGKQDRIVDFSPGFEV